MAKYEVPTSLFRIIYQGGKIFCKSLYKSIQEEIECSREAARMRYGSGEVNCDQSNNQTHFDLTMEEAKKILNVDELEPENVEKHYKTLFELNNKSNGGTLYLQSKIFRAKQRLDCEMRNLNSDL